MLFYHILFSLGRGGAKLNINLKIGKKYGFRNLCDYNCYYLKAYMKKQVEHISYFLTIFVIQHRAQHLVKLCICKELTNEPMHFP